MITDNRTKVFVGLSVSVVSLIISWALYRSLKKKSRKNAEKRSNAADVAGDMIKKYVKEDYTQKIPEQDSPNGADSIQAQPIADPADEPLINLQPDASSRSSPDDSSSSQSEEVSEVIPHIPLAVSTDVDLARPSGDADDDDFPRDISSISGVGDSSYVPSESASGYSNVPTTNDDTDTDFTLGDSQQLESSLSPSAKVSHNGTADDEKTDFTEIVEEEIVISAAAPQNSSLICEPEASLTTGEVVEEIFVAATSSVQNSSFQSVHGSSDMAESNNCDLSYDSSLEESTGAASPSTDILTETKPSSSLEEMALINAALEDIDRSMRCEEPEAIDGAEQQIELQLIKENCESNGVHDAVSTDSGISVATTTTTSSESVTAAVNSKCKIAPNDSSISHLSSVKSSTTNKLIPSTEERITNGTDEQMNGAKPEKSTQVSTVREELNSSGKSSPPCAIVTPQSQTQPESASPVMGEENKGPISTSRYSVGDQVKVYRFLMPAKLCGFFIGKGGHKITILKKETNTNIKIGREPVRVNFRYCIIEGSDEEIAHALRVIKKQYPNVDTAQVDEFGMPENVVLSPDRMQLHLPLGIFVDVLVCNIVNAGHLFVQQPTHPSFNSWQRMAECMNQCYSDVPADPGQAVPPLPDNVEEGVLCVAPDGNGAWLRAQLMSISEDRMMADVKYVDIGGYATTELQGLRQIRSDFLAFPFQAVECYMSNIEPADGNMFSAEADEMLNKMTTGHLVQAQTVAVAENDVPYVHIVSQTTTGTVFIVNRELATQGLVKWYH